jgi:hypothetical protein
LPEAGNPILSRESDVIGIQVTMGTMNLLRASNLNFRPVGVSLAALAVVTFATGCTNNSPESGATQETSIAAPTLEAEPTVSPNEIEPDAEREFRAALVKSQESAAESGLTELWFDTDGVLVQVAVQDPSTKTCASYDVDADSVFEMDETSMMPARTIAELDGLVAGGNDQGSVILSAPGEYTITNTIDLAKYVTVYTLDTEGRIAKSVISSDDEPLGEITYSYSITKEGKAALVALKATS